MIKRCPECGSMSFIVTAIVAQDWVVDEHGDFIGCASECTEVTHYPDDEDIWECNNCGYSAPGREFNTKE